MQIAIAAPYQADHPRVADLERVLSILGIDARIMNSRPTGTFRFTPCIVAIDDSGVVRHWYGINDIGGIEVSEGDLASELSAWATESGAPE